MHTTTQNVGAVYVGNVIQSSNDACYLSRHVGLKAGVPVHVPALTINRYGFKLCCFISIGGGSACPRSNS